MTWFPEFIFRSVPQTLTDVFCVFCFLFAEGEPSAGAGQPPSGAGERQPRLQTDHQQGRPEERSGQGVISRRPSQKGRNDLI